MAISACVAGARLAVLETAVTLMSLPWRGPARLRSHRLSGRAWRRSSKRPADTSKPPTPTASVAMGHADERERRVLCRSEGVAIEGDRGGGQSSARGGDDDGDGGDGDGDGGGNGRSGDGGGGGDDDGSGHRGDKGDDHGDGEERGVGGGEGGGGARGGFGGGGEARKPMGE